MVQEWFDQWGHQIKIYSCLIVFIEYAAFYSLSLARQSESTLKRWTALQVKRLPVETTVSIFDSHHERFPAHDLFGRDWSYRVVRLLDNGRWAALLHKRERTGGVSLWKFECGREQLLPNS